MAYSEDDLAVFTVLGKAELHGTAYFELHAGELPEPFACWLEESIFIRDAGFDFLVECFCRANKKFDYFAFEPFDASQIDKLVDELTLFLETLSPGCSRDVVFSQYSSLFTQSIWEEVGTDNIRVALAAATRHILEFANKHEKRESLSGFLGCDA
jgi:hypothetical protein